MDNTDEVIEQARRNRLYEINAHSGDRSRLEARYGKVWDTDELRTEFEVLGFMAPFVVVKRKRDNQKGSLEFQHSPRFYFSFTADQ
jgi:hypothetical protein